MFYGVFMGLSEIAPSSPKIDRIISRIEEGDIKIPAFQRGFVWDQEQVINLLDSIYRDYPIGSILLWNSHERLRSTRNVGGFLIPERTPQYPVNYVLDGQQRLSTIYAIFGKNRTEDPNNVQYKIDTEIFDIYFDLDEKEFLPKNSLKESHRNLRLNSLLNAGEFINEIKEYSPERRDVAVELQSKFQNYEVPIITTYKRKKEEVGIIFERINNTGTRLTTLDLMIAWTWSEDFHLKEKMDEILEILDQKGFGETPDKIILQCLSGIAQQTTKTKNILSMSPEIVKSNFETLKESLEKTIDFLSTELNMLSRDFLPHSHQIVPLTFFFSKVNTPSTQQSKALKQWFWKTSFSRRYAGSTDLHMDEDINIFNNIISNDFNGINKYSYSIDEKNLIDQRFTKGSPYTRAFLLLMAQKSPLNLVNGNKIDPGSALSKYNLKEYHHIFPRIFLKNKGIDSDKINSLLPSDSNKKISSKAPSGYIFTVIPQEHYSEILESNLMPVKKEIYQKDNYDEFLKQRAKKILDYLDSQLV